MNIVIDYASVDGNARPDFFKAKSACASAGSVLRAVIFRGSYGTLPDLVIGRDWKAAQDAGLQTGAYLYLRNRAGQPPIDQVHAFADVVGVLTAHDLVPSIDVEDSWPSPDAELEALHAAWSEMRRIYGVPPMLYDSNRVWVEDLHNSPAGEMTASPQWTAKPWPAPRRSPAILSPAMFADGHLDPLVPAPWGPKNWWLHQYQGDAFPMQGFSGTVDLSRFRLMAEGESGRRVQDVQARLGWPITGIFDEAMASRVRTFQSAHGLVSDAIIGLQTFTRILWTPPALG